jgi:hypothetical protein
MEEPTSKFLTCTNTLGALITAIVVSLPAPSNSSSAKAMAVSSEYYITTTTSARIHNPRMPLKYEGNKNGNEPRTGFHSNPP